MTSFKQLKSSDVITVPVIANKQWNFNYCYFPQSDPYIKVYNGTNITGVFDPGSEPVTNNQYDRLVYSQINQLFYHQYSGSLSTSSLASSLFYESASEDRPTSSYFNFNDDPTYVGYFPTGSGESIKVLSISTNLYGQRILPYSFQITSSTNYVMYDDGKGNVWDNLSQHVGNIFYPEGIIVITNQNYQSIFSLPPVAYNTTIEAIRSNYGNPVTISISPLNNADLRGNTLLNQSIVLLESGINYEYFSTGSNNTVSMSFEGSGVGTYQTFYTFLVTGSYCRPLVSNTGSITVNITDADCIFEMSIIGVSPSPTPSITPTISITPTVTPTISISSTPANTPFSTPSITPTITLSPTISGTPGASTTPTISITPTVTPTISISATPGLSPSSTPPITPTISKTPSISITPTISKTPTPTPTRTITPTPTPSTSITIYDFTALYRCPDVAYFETKDIPYDLITGANRVICNGVYYVVMSRYQGPTSPWDYPNLVGTSIVLGEIGCPAPSPTPTPSITPTNAVYGIQIRTANDPISICSNTTFQAAIISPVWEGGTIFYTDESLTTRVSGTYIMMDIQPDQPVYNLLDGVLGSVTGYTCYPS